MKFARIEDSIVVEILEADSLPEFHPSLVWVECPQWVGEGMIYESGRFSQVIISIGELKAKKILEAQSVYDEKIKNGYTHKGNVYQIDDKSRGDMEAVFIRLNDKAKNPHRGAWRDKSNNMIAMNDKNVELFIEAVFEYVFDLKQELWNHKDNVNGLFTAQEINEYDIEVNW